MAVFHKIPLPKYPTESTVKEYLREIFIPKACIRIQQESRMVGNDEGLNGFDVMLRRLETLEKKDESRQEELSTLRSDMELIHIPELLRFLPQEKRPDNLLRNDLVHGANIKF